MCQLVVDVYNRLVTVVKRVKCLKWQTNTVDLKCKTVGIRVWSESPTIRRAQLVIKAFLNPDSNHFN